MKKYKSALGLLTLAAACATLSGCNQATSDSNGSVFTYTDAEGNVVSYSAQDLLNSYQTSGSSVSTEFDKIYEVLVRHYYDSLTDTSVLTELKRKAQADVDNSKQTASENATNNGTTYNEEIEKIEKNLGVKNIDELYDYHLYTEEKTKYEKDYNDGNLNAMRDGSSKGLLEESDLLFAGDAKYGRSSKGWIKENLPYQMRHILVKVSAGSGEYTQGQLSEDGSSTAGEATKLSKVIMRLAGADTTNVATGDSLIGYKTIDNVDSRESFGSIAKESSDDSSSAVQFGELTSLMTKINNLVPEFGLGTFAFETLYNKKTGTTDYGKKNMDSLTPGLKEEFSYAESYDASKTIADKVDPSQVLDDSGKTVYDYFKDGEVDSNGDTGIGQIPYGAAVALLDVAKTTKDANGASVYEDNTTFFPRNVIFNKYFNKHNICVITPNDIPYTLGTDIPDDGSIESTHGTYSSKIAALPGFSRDTTGIVNAGGGNVLTDSEGQIVLAVRAGTSDYQGIHFIVVQRSGLDLYGDYATAQQSDVANLSQYYTMSIPGDTDYPTKTSGTDAQPMDTFVNYNRHSTNDYTTRKNSITDSVKGYNGALNTYLFKDLVSTGSIKFNDSAMEARIQNYSDTKRQSTVDDNFNTWQTSWKTYAEMLEAQNAAKNRQRPVDSVTGKRIGNASDQDCMLSEQVAIDYRNANTLIKGSDADWTEGGRCYYAK